MSENIINEPVVSAPINTPILSTPENAPIKRKRGRPRKGEEVNSRPLQVILATSVSTTPSPLDITVVKEERKKMAIPPELASQIIVLAKTMSGVEIGIKYICSAIDAKGEVKFIDIVRPRERSYTCMISSLAVFKPDFGGNKELEEMFAGITWYIPPPLPVAEPVELEQVTVADGEVAQLSEPSSDRKVDGENPSAPTLST